MIDGITSAVRCRFPGMLLCLLLSAGRVSAQTALPAGAADAPPPDRGGEWGFDILKHFSFVLFPKVFSDAWQLREYVRSDEFAQFRREQGDPAAVDAMFARARELSWHNDAEALMISLAASIDHRQLGIMITPISLPLWLPLTSELPGEFEERIAALPRQLYPDTPDGPAGDRDKLQHFFGSAFLAFVFESPEPAERIGDAVEWGEERFVVGGANDPRDLRADWQGRQFGLRLLNESLARPSQFLRVVLAHQPLPPTNGPARTGEEHFSVDPEVR